MTVAERSSWLKKLHHLVYRDGVELIAAELPNYIWAFVLPTTAEDLRQQALHLPTTT